MKIRVEKQIGAQILSFETGQLAKQASACVIAQYGDTVVLSAAATGPSRPGTDFFPLTCDYRERMAAAGKFPGGFLKREGRPTMKETLTSRLIDRPIRPRERGLRKNWAVSMGLQSGGLLGEIAFETGCAGRAGTAQGLAEGWQLRRPLPKANRAGAGQ